MKTLITHLKNMTINNSKIKYMKRNILKDDRIY